MDHPDDAQYNEAAAVQCRRATLLRFSAPVLGRHMCFWREDSGPGVIVELHPDAEGEPVSGKSYYAVMLTCTCEGASKR